MRAIDWRQINWLAVVVNSIYVLVLGVAVAFFARVFNLDQWSRFEAAFTLVLAFIVLWVSYRVATRARSEPLMHGLLIGLLVGLTNMLLNYLTLGLAPPEVAGSLMQVLAGLLGGRMAQKVMESAQP